MTEIIPQTPVVNAGFMYVSGLKLTYSNEFEYVLSKGAARDSSNTIDIIVENDLTLSVLYAGINGLDVGTVGQSVCYAVYVIADSSGYKKTAAILSLNTLKPLLPVGYDCYRRVGWISTGTEVFPSHVLKFYQYGEGETKRYIYDKNTVQTIIFEGNSNTFSQISISPAVVPKIACEIYISSKYEQAFSSNRAHISPGGAVSSNGFVILGDGNLSTQYDQFTMPCTINNSGFASIQYKTGPGAGDKLSLYATGFKDLL